MYVVGGLELVDINEIPQLNKLNCTSPIHCFLLALIPSSGSGISSERFWDVVETTTIFFISFRQTASIPTAISDVDVVEVEVIGFCGSTCKAVLGTGWLIPIYMVRQKQH